MTYEILEWIKLTQGEFQSGVFFYYTVTTLHTMKTYWTVAVLLHAFLTCTVYMELGDQLHAPSALLSGNRPCTL